MINALLELKLVAHGILKNILFLLNFSKTHEKGVGLMVMALGETLLITKEGVAECFHKLK